MADRFSLPTEVPPPAGPRKYWSRRGIAEWLATVLSEDRRTIVGIDHGFSFPLEYFEWNRVPHDWVLFLEDFQRHWPTDGDHTYVDFVRDGNCGLARARSGKSRWRRLTEIRTFAKSVFHFDVPGSVAKSTHSGLPWLLYLRRRLGKRVHFWPFDGWSFPKGQSLVAEVYPALLSARFPREGRDEHQHDAYSIAAWLRAEDLDGTLAVFASPYLDEEQLWAAQIEGWILGVL